MAADAHLDRIRAQFTRQAEAYARLRQTTDERSLAGLVRLSGARPGDRVLDVACGPGFLTRAFARHGCVATGLDATEAFLAFARAEAAEARLAVDLRTGDATALPFDAAAFDVVACRAAFHHFPEPARVLAEMARVVRPTGRLLVADMVGAEDAEVAARHDAIERLCDPTHVRALSRSAFARLVADAGLALATERGGTVEYEVEEWMSHGGLDAAAAAEIRARLEASIDGDTTGLRVRRTAGTLVLTHTTAAFVLVRAET